MGAAPACRALGLGGASVVGLAIAAAWWFTATVAATSMEAGLAPIQALSFTGPSAEVLTRVLFAPDKPPTFDLGLVPGVFLGAFVAAALFRRAQARRLCRRRLDAALPDRRAADGLRRHDGRRLRSRRGPLGAAVFTVTSWVALSAMWAGAALTDRLIDQHGHEAAQPHLGDQPVPASRAFT